MTVKQLVKILKTLNQDAVMLMARDPEINGAHDVHNVGLYDEGIYILIPDDAFDHNENAY